MQLAVNYSRPLADLVRDGRVSLDRFKCPAWPDLVDEALRIHASYVHFPLSVGLGTGEAYDFDARAPADWRKVEALLTQTGTPYVNLHFGPHAHDFPAIPVDSEDPAHRERLIEAALRDMRNVCARFGAERVMLENDHAEMGIGLRLAISPETICAVVEAAGCGFLLDLSHARLAARWLGVDARAYTRALPVSRIREIHVTGMQVFGESLAVKARQMGVAERLVAKYTGQWMDHLPMTESDYEHLAWALEQIRAGVWAEPWAVSHEVGGVGGLWEMIAQATPYVDEVKRLHGLVHSNGERVG